MSLKMIQTLRKTKLDIIVGDFYGGNDEGGINSVSAIVLKPEFPSEGWPAHDWEDYKARKKGNDREVLLSMNLNGHCVNDRWVNGARFIGGEEDIAKAGIPAGLNLYESFVKPFDDIICQRYGSFAGEFTVSGEFYATRDGRFKVDGCEEIPRSESVCLAEESYV